MTGQELALGSFNPSRAPIPKKRRASASFIRAISGAGLLAVAAWIVATRLHYTPGSDLGYNLGIAGGTALLVITSYSIHYTKLYEECRLFKFRILLVGSFNQSA